MGAPQVQNTPLKKDHTTTKPQLNVFWQGLTFVKLVVDARFEQFWVSGCEPVWVEDQQQTQFGYLNLRK